MGEDCIIVDEDNEHDDLEDCLNGEWSGDGSGGTEQSDERIRYDASDRFELL